MPLDYKILELLFRAASRYLKNRIEGIENVPPKGQGYIAASNHRSFADAIILPQTLVTARNEPIHMVSYAELFRVRVIRVILWWARGLVLDRTSTEGVERFFRDAKKILVEKREGVGLHPEGHISKTGKLGRGRPGAAKLALETGCPVLPIGLFGTDVVMSPIARKLNYKRRALSFRAGKPISFNGYRTAYEEGDDAAKKEILDGCTTIIMLEIAKLTGQTYRFGKRSLERLAKYGRVSTQYEP
jgi:1-acyl-sn-glycerol-3-phosphate acyltransferase